MKISNYFTLALAAIALVSCNNNKEGDIQGQKRVTVKISATAISKAVDKTSVTFGTKTPINDVSVFFLDGNDVVVSTPQAMTAAEAATGKTFTGVNAATVKVFLVANTVNSLTSGALFPALSGIGINSTKAQIEALAASIETQMDNTTDMGISNVVLSGEAILITTGALDYTSHVTIAPSVCRFEITSITGITDITAFDLDAIYINTYYPQFTIGGGSAGTYYGLSTNLTELGQVASYMKDINLGKTGSATYSSSAGKVWAYMLPVANTTPRIIFKLDNLHVSGTITSPSTKYVTVKNFKDANTGDFIVLKRGEVYVVKDVKFDANSTTVDPNDEPINVTVTVEVLAWKTYFVDPIV